MPEKQQPMDPDHQNDPHHQNEDWNESGNEPSLGDMLSQEDLDRMSTLQLLDWIAQTLPPRHPALMDLVYLRGRVEELEEIQDQAREALEQMDSALKKLRTPAFRVGSWLAPIAPDRALVCVNSTEYVCEVDPQVPVTQVRVGDRVLLNEAYAVVDLMDVDRGGVVVRVDQVLSDGRLRIGSETSGGSQVLIRSSALAKEKIKPGMEVRLDVNQRVAVEILGMEKRVERSLETVPEMPWDHIGGQEEAVKMIRETIEFPFLHRDLYKKFDHSIPKGFLLHGPPGCGKTLMGKATAYNLREQIRKETGEDRPEFFLSVKGPEVLNMWVGESERQVRDLFSQCREKAAEGALAFLFIDEAESILGVRRSGRYSSILSTLVPMFCAEMDGIEPLSNVIIILASNRADLIDPAILRPGRIDRKIRVRRPGKEQARDIYGIYLKETLPLAEPREDLIQAIVEEHFSQNSKNRFLEVTYRSGKRIHLYRGDLASGAIIAAIVERAKSIAIRRGVADPDPENATLTREDLITALDLEYTENDLFPTSDLTDDWLRLTDLNPDNVVRIGKPSPQPLGKRMRLGS